MAQKRVELQSKELVNVYGGSEIKLTYLFTLERENEQANTYKVIAYVRGLELGLYMDVMDVELPEQTNEDTLTESAVIAEFEEYFNN